MSTKEQATKGGRDEGFSIPAQRAANHSKAESLGAAIIKEFVDAGESAKKADLPALREMISYVKRHKVAYCIVHKVDRLSRNRADDVEIHMALRKAGVMLVSATENIDETTKQEAIAWAEQRNASNEKSDVVTQDLFLQARVTTSLIGCPNVDETVSSFTALKSLISRGSDAGRDNEVSILPVHRTDVRGPVVTPVGTAVTPVSTEVLESMAEAYESGASLVTIAHEHRLGKETVRDLLADAGVRIRRQGLDDGQVKHAIRRYKAGLTTREVAGELGVSHSMVWRALKRAGVALRPQARLTRQKS